MAAPPVTLDTPHAARVGNTQFGVAAGDVTVSSYDTAHPAVSAITGLFKSGGSVTVCPNGATNSGYIARWDDSTSSFILYTPAASGAAIIEAASGTNCGSFDWIAIGQIGL